MDRSKNILIGGIAIVVIGGAYLLFRGDSAPDPSVEAVAAGSPISYVTSEDALKDVSSADATTRERAILAYARRTFAEYSKNDAITPEHVEPLIDRLKKDPNPVVRAAAATGLGTLQSNQALETLGGALEDDDVRVQGRSKMAIARITGITLNFEPGGPEKDRQRALDYFHKILMPQIRSARQEPR
jgi:HEAT repeat protein